MDMSSYARLPDSNRDNFVEVCVQESSVRKEITGKMNYNSQKNCNKPMNDEYNRDRSDPHQSEPSGSSLPRPPVPEPAMRRDQQMIEPSMSQSAPEHGSARFSQPDDDSYPIPQQSSIHSAPRMIPQSSSGKSGSENAFKRLKSMGSSGERIEKLPSLPPPGDLGQYGYPTTGKAKSSKGSMKYPGQKAYRVTRLACCCTTLMAILLSVCIIVSLIVAFVDVAKCGAVSAMIILMDILLLVILFLEWIRKWLWREPTPLSQKNAKLSAQASMRPANGTIGLPAITSQPGPIANPTYPTLTANDSEVGGFLSFGFQQRLYDVPQFISALCLIVLYLIGAICVVIAMLVAAGNMKACGRISACAIGIGAVFAVLIGLRLVMCCVSDACRGLLHKTAAPEPASMVAVNQLNQILPGMGGHWHSGGAQDGMNAKPTSWLLNLSGGCDPRHQLSMIKPITLNYTNEMEL